MAATGTKTRVSKVKSAKASVPVKSSSGSAAAKLIIAKETKLKQGHWDQLRQSSRLAVWKIAALSVGVAPVRGIRTLLEKSGQITLLKKLDDRRGIVRDNLTAKAESGGLQYVHDAVGDRQKSANTQNPFNLVVELVTFVLISTQTRMARIQGMAACGTRAIGTCDSWTGKKSTFDTRTVGSDWML